MRKTNVFLMVSNIISKYVPQNGVQNMYVPQLPHMGYMLGTKVLPILDFFQSYILVTSVSL